MQEIIYHPNPIYGVNCALNTIDNAAIWLTTVAVTRCHDNILMLLMATLSVSSMPSNTEQDTLLVDNWIFLDRRATEVAKVNRQIGVTDFKYVGKFSPYAQVT